MLQQSPPASPNQRRPSLPGAARPVVPPGTAMTARRAVPAVRGDADDLPPGPLATGHPPSARRGRATAMLLLATALWGLSFPLAKAAQTAQLTLLTPGASTWFLAGLALVFRFGLAAAILLAAAARTLRTLDRREAWQGLGLGLFGGGGMFLQMDGLNYTAASTSAFLTNCFCVIVPIIVAVQRRRWPPRLIVICCGLVVVGMAILAGVNPHDLRLGRGELETVCSAFFFAGQIFWLERPGFHKNRTTHASLVMFGTIAVLGAGALWVNSRGAPAREFVAACASWPVFGILLALTLLCTLCTFTLMNHWQKHLEATEAGLIYCAEPVFTSASTLFLPALLAALAGVDYANEPLTARLLLGGGLITLANIAIQLKPRAVTPVR